MITDYIIVGALFYFFFRGWNKGFLKTLIGPIALIISGFTGYTHYQKTQDMNTALLICIAGPIIISILLSFSITLWRKAAKSDTPPSLTSALLGSSFSILWSGSYLALFLILIGMVPIRAAWFEKIQEDVTLSKSYSFIRNWADDKIPIVSFDVKKVIRILQDPAKLEQFESTEEFQNLMEDDQLKGLFSDKEISEQIQNKNYSRLLSNPKMQAIFQDKELLKKIFAFNKMIMEESSEDDPAKKSPESEPKVIDIE